MALCGGFITNFLPMLKQSSCGHCVGAFLTLLLTSPTFAQWVGVELTETNFRQLWIPEGFAHGFVALSETAEVAYKCTNYWVKEAEASIRWNDPTIGITWPLETTPLLSEKDLLSPSLDDARLFP